MAIANFYSAFPLLRLQQTLRLSGEETRHLLLQVCLAPANAEAAPFPTTAAVSSVRLSVVPILQHFTALLLSLLQLELCSTTSVLQQR